MCWRERARCRRQRHTAMRSHAKILSFSCFCVFFFFIFLCKSRHSTQTTLYNGGGGDGDGDGGDSSKSGRNKLLPTPFVTWHFDGTHKRNTTHSVNYLHWFQAIECTMIMTDFMRTVSYVLRRLQNLLTQYQYTRRYDDGRQPHPHITVWHVTFCHFLKAIYFMAYIYATPSSFLLFMAHSLLLFFASSFSSFFPYCYWNGSFCLHFPFHSNIKLRINAVSPPKKEKKITSSSVIESMW